MGSNDRSSCPLLLCIRLDIQLLLLLACFFHELLFPECIVSFPCLSSPCQSNIDKKGVNGFKIARKYDACVGTTDQFASLKSVFGLGLFEETFDSEEAEKIQKKLDETTKLIWELQEVQNERLSTKPPPNMVCLLAPSVKEVQIADKVNENLKELTQQVTPGDIVSVPGIRKAMGILSPYVDTEEMLVDLTTADTQQSQAIPKNGSEFVQIVT